jgi:cyclophilin family peptidyl-prolyl cis-trans isomerase
VETSSLLHSKRGTLSLVPVPLVGLTSHFMVTFGAVRGSDGRNQVIGELVEGFGVLDVISTVGNPMSNSPLSSVVITNCGVHQPIQQQMNDDIEFE